MNLDDIQYIILENERLLARAQSLETGPGGIMEMKQTIADKERRIDYLEAKMREIIEVPLWDEYRCIEIAREALSTDENILHQI
mgnify:FL=1|jgi:hypothetical protein